MFFGQTINDTRQLFYTSWHKHLKQHPLSALEKNIVEVIRLHPEFQPLFDTTNQDTTAYTPDSKDNPFLHLGLHLAIREQVATDRPQGIKAIYGALVRTHDALATEHLMMQCLAQMLWQAQQANMPPDEQTYLSLLRALL